MIEVLSIKNIGIIEDLVVEFKEGLNVITGETGAGKTLIIDSLGIIAGGRFSKEMIRKGETNSYVEVSIYDKENEKAIDGNIIVSREINSNGKNMCKINGRMITVAELKEFMSKYIEIHGQNDNISLLDNKKHIGYLDGFIGKELNIYKIKYFNLYARYLEINKELKLNYGDDKEKQRKIDLLNYQIKEIEESKLKENEEEDLEEKRKIMMNSEKIVNGLKQADSCISENGIDSISLAIRSLEKIELIDDKYKKISDNLKNCYYELQEVSRDIIEEKENIYFDEEERIYIEQRLDLVNSLKRKYGNTINEILCYMENIKKEIKDIENLEANNNKLKIELEDIILQMNEVAKLMHDIRNKKAKILSSDINNCLEDLEMKNAKVNIHVNYLEEDFLKNGKDEVIFYIKTNFGEDEKELSKIASGGEMSRIMLSIKKVLSQSDEIATLIFDEIDTGISGKAANAVAKKLKSISENHQVMCISHLPNIAASADYNYYISKRVNNNRTISTVKLLKEDEVINEIARISSGEINDISIKYASELRNKKVV